MAIAERILVNHREPAHAFGRFARMIGQIGSEVLATGGQRVASSAVSTM